jgi:hypothetical protein
MASDLAFSLGRDGEFGGRPKNWNHGWTPINTDGKHDHSDGCALFYPPPSKFSRDFSFSLWECFDGGFPLTYARANS